jgi:hypothetical protein
MRLSMSLSPSDKTITADAGCGLTHTGLLMSAPDCCGGHNAASFASPFLHRECSFLIFCQLLDEPEEPGSDTQDKWEAAGRGRRAGSRGFRA